MVRQTAILENVHWDELTALVNQVAPFVDGPIRMSRNDLIRLSLIHLYGTSMELSAKDKIKLTAIERYHQEKHLAKAIE